MALGQMGKLLEASKPHYITPQPGAGAFSVTPGLPDSGVTTLVAPNEGGQQFGSAVGGGASKTIGGVTYYQAPDGQWHDTPPNQAGGPTQPASGTFPPGR